MRNYIDSGETVTVPAPYALTSGAGALVGTLFGVAQTTVAAGAPAVLVTRGVFDLPKAGAQAWALGAAIYWDDTNKLCTNTVAGNTLIGRAVLAVSNGAGETTGRIRLIG